MTRMIMKEIHARAAEMGGTGKPGSGLSDPENLKRVQDILGEGTPAHRDCVIPAGWVL